MELEKGCAICDSTSKGVAVACCQSRPYSIMSSFLPLYLNKLLPQHLSVRLQNSSVNSQDVTWERLCYLRLYVKGRGRGMPSKLAILNSVEFFSNVWEPTPPRAFFPMFGNQLLPGILSVWLQHLSFQSEDGAKQMLCSFATLRQRAWPWRAVKVGSVVFFSKVCELSPPREFISSALKSVSTVRIRCKTNVVLFVTLCQRAWPWRFVKVGHFLSNVKLWCHLCHSLTLMLATMSLPVNAPIHVRSCRPVRSCYDGTWRGRKPARGPVHHCAQF